MTIFFIFLLLQIANHLEGLFEGLLLEVVLWLCVLFSGGDSFKVAVVLPASSSEQ